jgi:hypothetical protein
MSKDTTSITYLLEVSKDVWAAFKIVAGLQGLKVKEAVPLALAEYVENHKGQQVQIDVAIVHEAKKNLLSFVYEEELSRLLNGMIEAKKRNAPTSHINDLKRQALEILKKHPALPPSLAEEVVSVFKNMT